MSVSGRTLFASGQPSITTRAASPFRTAGPPNWPPELATSRRPSLSLELGGRAQPLQARHPSTHQPRLLPTRLFLLRSDLSKRTGERPQLDLPYGKLLESGQPNGGASTSALWSRFGRWAQRDCVPVTKVGPSPANELGELEWLAAFGAFVCEGRLLLGWPAGGLWALLGGRPGGGLSAAPAGKQSGLRGERSWPPQRPRKAPKGRSWNNSNRFGAQLGRAACKRASEGAADALASSAVARDSLQWRQ